MGKTRSSHVVRAAVATCPPASRKANCGAMLAPYWQYWLRQSPFPCESQSKNRPGSRLSQSQSGCGNKLFPSFSNSSLKRSRDYSRVINNRLLTTKVPPKLYCRLMSVISCCIKTSWRWQASAQFTAYKASVLQFEIGLSEISTP